MSKKIVFFIGSMHGGGAERVVSILANHYQTIGWDVSIALLLDTKVGYKLDRSIKVVDLSQSNGSYIKRLPKWFFSIRRFVKQAKPDKIVSFIGRINVLVLTACIGIKIPVIVSERNDPKHDGRSSMMLKACNWSYKRAKAIVFQTKYEQSCFSSKLNNGTVIVNPVSVTIEPKEKERPYEIVTAGRLLPQKNQMMLIDAVAKVNSKNASLKIYGEGDLKEKLQKRIDELNINAELCGNVSDLHKRINGAGIFVLCSEFEGLSNALIEAMMLGLVCISTNYPGAEEVIIDGENGLLVPCGDVGGLANAIVKVFGNNELRKKLSSGAKITSEKYKESLVLSEWDKIIG